MNTVHGYFTITVGLVKFYSAEVCNAIISYSANKRIIIIYKLSNINLNVIWDNLNQFNFLRQAFDVGRHWQAVVRLRKE